MARRLQEYEQKLAESSKTGINQEVNRINSGGLFGMAGGILGRKRGILEREIDRRVTEGEAAQQATLFDMADDSIARNMKVARSPEDVARMEALQARVGYYRRMGDVSAIPKILELSDGFYGEQEQQRIAAEEVQRAANATEFDRRRTAVSAESKRLYDEIYAPFRPVEQSYRIAIRNLDSGNPTAIRASIVNLAKMADPTTGIRNEAELRGYTGNNGILVQFRDELARLTGDAPSPETITGIRTTLTNFYNGYSAEAATAYEDRKIQLELAGYTPEEIRAITGGVPTFGGAPEPAQVGGGGGGGGGDGDGGNGDGPGFLETALAYAAAVPLTAYSALPDPAKTVALGAASYAGWQGLKRLPAAIQRGATALSKALTPSAMSRIFSGARTVGSGPVGAGLTAYSWLIGENAADVEQLLQRRPGESADEYRQRVYEGIQSRSDVGAFLTPDMIKVPE